MRMSLLFLFQAEDSIRDDLVTGVQTCALPILGVDEEALRHEAQQEAERLWATVPEWHWEGLTTEQLSPPAFQPLDEIGRASCRERVLVCEVVGRMKGGILDLVTSFIHIVLEA